MKKFITMLATVCALGAFADVETLDDGNIAYKYTLLEGDAVELVGADPKLQGSELDLAAVQKLFSGEGLRIVQLANPADIVEDPEAITSVVLSEYMEDWRTGVQSLFSSLPNAESATGGSTVFTTIDGLVYADGGRILVRCPKARAGAVKLPSNCRQILPYAFAGCQNLTGVSGGAEVLRVKSCAFGDLSEPDELAKFIRDLPDGLVMVGRAVIGWKGANVPATIELPSSATSVADNAFPESVTNVTGGAGVMWVGENAFEGFVQASPSGELVMVGRVLIGAGHHGDIIPTITPPVDTVAIAPRAFEAFNAIVELDLAELSMLEVIGYNAFERCRGLENVVLPDGVKEIQVGAFNTCDRLRSFTFGKATETLGYGMFESCKKLEDVYFRCENAPQPDFESVDGFQAGFYSETAGTLVTHALPNSTGWELDGSGKWCERKFDRELRRDAVTGYVGYYGKWPLAKLGVAVPPAGTVYTAVAYGLPKGLVLKANAAVKKKGKIVIPAKTSWWIEGVPSTTLDRITQTVFVRTTVNGVSTLHPLDLEVIEQGINDYDLKLNEFVVQKPGYGASDKGWTVSNLPKGLKQAVKATKVKVGRKTYSVPAYSIYGTPTVHGNRIVTAKKKTGSWYEVRKYRYRVLQADGTPVEDVPVDSRPTVGLDFNDSDGTKPLKVQGGLRENGGKAVIKTFTSEPGATLKLVGAPATLSLEEESEGSGNWKLVGFALPGDYHVSVVATKDGRDDARQTVLVHSEALPAWAKGTFSGYVAGMEDEETLWGYFTMTVSAKGEISGKLDRDGESYVFTVDAYASGDESHFSAPDIVLKQYTTVRRYDKKTKKWVTGKKLVDTEYRLDVGVFCGVTGVLTGQMWSEEEPDDILSTVVAQQNRWGNTYKSIGAGLFTASAKQAYKTFKISSGYDLPEGASLSFKITPSGAVTVTGSFPNGWKTVTVKGRKQRVRTYKSVIRSTMLIPETHPDVGAVGFRGRIAVYLPDAYKVDGLSRDFTHIFDFPFEVEGKTWYTGEFNTPACVMLPRTFAEATTQASYRQTYGMCNVKVKDSLAFTGTFTPAGTEQAVSFSGTFRLSTNDTVGAVNTSCYVATSKILWNGWTIPFEITLEKDWFGNDEVGRIRFGGTSASDASFRSDEHFADNFAGGHPNMQDFWRRLSPHPIAEGEWTVFCNTFWPDLNLVEDVAIFNPTVSSPSAAAGDWLTYRYRSNGRVSIDGVINGYEVKTSSVVQIIEQTDTGYRGCFFVNLGASGLFVQKCLVEFDDLGDSVATECEPLQCVWSPDYE